MSFLKRLFGGGSDRKKKPEVDPSLTAHADISLHHVEYGRHGDHHSALFGFAEGKAAEQRFTQLIQEHIAAAMVTPTGNYQGITVGEHKIREAAPSLTMRSVAFEDQMISAFPLLRTRRSLPFKTTAIYRWQNVNDLEAEIEGAGRDAFKLGFFAADWLKNRAAYYGRNQISIHLAAFALVMDDHDNSSTPGEPTFADDFCAYMLMDDLPGPSYINFVGIVREVEAVKAAGQLGYLLNVNLINNPDDPDFFAIDVYLNAANSRMAAAPKVGGHITGVLWLVGELAE